MDVDLLRMLERCTLVLQRLQARVDQLSAAFQTLQARQAAFEEACVDSFVCIYDDMPRGKGVHHGA